MIYFTSDFHFCHNKEFCYKARNFDNVGEMNETILQNINNKVSEDDELYVLGDVYLNSDEGIEFVRKINCKNIHLIIGNHDTETKANLLIKSGKIIDTCYANIIKYGKFHFYLSHYPTYTGYEEKHLNTALINLYGHTHQKDLFYKDNDGNNIPWMYNVGVDAHNCTPVSVEEVLEDCRNEFNLFINRKVKEE